MLLFFQTQLIQKNYNLINQHLHQIKLEQDGQVVHLIYTIQNYLEVLYKKIKILTINYNTLFVGSIQEEPLRKLTHKQVKKNKEIFYLTKQYGQDMKKFLQLTIRQSMMTIKSFYQNLKKVNINQGMIYHMLEFGLNLLLLTL